MADWEFFFTLVNDKGDYALSQLDGKKMFTVWSAEEYAELCKVDGWEVCSIKKLDLDDLENEIIDFIVDEDCLINVFPIYDKTGFVVSLKEFSSDLSEELSNYS
ncbi:Protein of unknown function [Chryseobacterium carnipullorum]|nr:Protein of unknown function [Chryseobacterium carnipullorum]